MQSKLDKMSALINEFAEAKVVLKDGIISIEYNWREPAAKESFLNFRRSIEKDQGIVVWKAKTYLL